MGIIQKLSDIFRGSGQESKSIKHMSDSSVPTGQPAEVVGLPPAPALPAPSPMQKDATEPRAPGVRNVVLDEAGLSILDLRELPSSRFRIVGSGFWVTDSGRYKYGGTDYLLVREPRNKWDANAVAVYGKGRKVGHLSEAKAAAFAPIFDALPHDAYRVGGAPPEDNSIRMWVDIPAIPKLRALAKTLPKGGVS